MMLYHIIIFTMNTINLNNPTGTVHDKKDISLLHNENTVTNPELIYWRKSFEALFFIRSTGFMLIQFNTDWLTDHDRPTTRYFLLIFGGIYYT